MILSMAEIMLLIDTLNGSLSFINDERPGSAFHYSRKDREQMFQKLFLYMNETKVSIETENIGESSNR